MTNDEGKALVRTILDTIYDGGAPIGPDDMFGAMAWGYWSDGTPTVISIFDDPLLRITTGAVVEIPTSWSPELFKAVSKINESLYYGRAWADAHADGNGMFVLLQELVPLSLLSMDHQASIDYLMALVRGLPGAAAQSAQEVMAACGGKPWTNLLVLAMSG